MVWLDKNSLIIPAKNILDQIIQEVGESESSITYLSSVLELLQNIC